MAKGRMLDKVIILSKKLNKISEGAENLYYRTLVCVDDYGRYHADPEIIKGQIYPRRKISISIIKKRLDELWKAGLIKLYEDDGETYLEITSFEKHQKFRADIQKKAECPEPKGFLQGSRNAPDTTCDETEQGETERCSKLSKDKIIQDNVETHKKIIDYFNAITGQKRSYSCAETNKLINGRLSDGKTFEDFLHVIDTKADQWLNDPKMRKFLRPSTLFREGNFEDYLNELYQKPHQKRSEVGQSQQKPTKEQEEFYQAREKKLDELNERYRPEFEQAQKDADMRAIGQIDNKIKEELAEWSKQYWESK